MTAGFASERRPVKITAAIYVIYDQKFQMVFIATKAFATAVFIHHLPAKALP